MTVFEMQVKASLYLNEKYKYAEISIHSIFNSSFCIRLL